MKKKEKLDQVIIILKLIMYTWCIIKQKLIYYLMIYSKQKIKIKSLLKSINYKNLTNFKIDTICEKLKNGINKN